MAFNWLKKKKKKADVKIAEDSILESQKTNEVIESAIDTSTSKNPPDPETEMAAQKAGEAENDDQEQQNLQKKTTDAENPITSKNGLFSRLKSGLSKTRRILTSDIENLFQGKLQVDEEMLEDLEELLITSDIGVRTSSDLISAISKKTGKIKGAENLKEVIKEEILRYLTTDSSTEETKPYTKPHIVMVVGVNGVGKTTTIGKLASRKINQGEKVLIAAADTFRAAATEQLAVWAKRSGADFVHHKENADPAAVAYDGVKAAQARGIDTVYIDTAGRLHTKVNLMEELKKIKRSIAKIIPEAPHEILLVLDATTGQNALAQAKLFDESLGGLSGLALTKLDGTAKGGVVISICRELNLPIHYIGVGEAIEDLQPFDAKRFVDALF